MTRWLWPLVATFLITASVSAMIFDRIDHGNLKKNEWSVAGLKIPLSGTSDFYPLAALVVGSAFLICAAFLWLHARAPRRAKRRILMLPSVGPMPNRTHFERQLDAIVRIMVASMTAGVGTYAAVHLFRHLVMHPVFQHTSKQMYHAAGLMQHVAHWSLSSDLRYGHPEGVTYYAGLEPSFVLLELVAGLFFVVWTIMLVLRPVTSPGTDINHRKPDAPYSSRVSTPKRKPPKD